MFHQWSIGTINIRTGKEDEKLENVVHQIDKARLSICGLQEVRRLKMGSALIESKTEGCDKSSRYEVHWSGYSVKREHGVGIAVRVEKGIDVVEVIPVSARIIVLDVVVYGCALRIINCYAPTELDSDSAKSTFYTALNKQFNVTGVQKVICVGDFNATTSAAWYNSSLREKVVITDLEVNNNGERFHNFFGSHCLSVLNTWFTHKNCRRITWHSGDGRTKKVYDFILSCSWIRQYVTNCRVYNSYDFDSDHRIVIAHLTTPCTKAARYTPRSVKSQKSKKQRLDLKSLNDPDIPASFVNVAGVHLEAIDLTADNETINSQLVSSMNNAADETIPKRKNNRVLQPWQEDATLKELYDQRDLQRKNNASSKTINTTTKKIRKRAQCLRDEHFKAEADKINQIAISRKLDKLFAKRH